jgi:hypothetical protein
LDTLLNLARLANHDILTRRKCLFAQAMGVMPWPLGHREILTAAGGKTLRWLPRAFPRQPWVRAVVR